MIRSIAETVCALAATSTRAGASPAAVQARQPDRARRLFLLFASIVAAVNLVVFALLISGDSLDATLLHRPFTVASAAMAVSLAAFVREYFQCGNPGFLRIVGAAWFVTLALAFGMAMDPDTAAAATAAKTGLSPRPWAVTFANLLTCMFLAELAWRCRRHDNPELRRHNRFLLPPFIAIQALAQAYVTSAGTSVTATLVAQTLPFTLLGIAFAPLLLRDGALPSGLFARWLPNPAVSSLAARPRIPQAVSSQPNRPEPDLPGSDAMFRRMVDGMPYGLLVVDRAGRVAYANLNASRLFGHGQDALTGQPVLSLVPTRHVAELREALEQACGPDAASPPAPREGIGLGANGAEIPLEFSIERLGEVEQGAVLMSVRDVTAQKQADQRLRREIAFLRQVIDVIPNQLYVRDGGGRFVLANQAIADLYGTTVDALIGRRDEDFKAHETEIESSLRTDRATLETLQEQVIDEEYVTDAAGRGHWMRTTKRPLVGRGDHENMVLGSSFEITPYKQTALELVRQREALARLSRVNMLGELSGSLVHELNQPLAAILANAQAAQKFLTEEIPDLEELKDILHDIVADDKRAGKVIEGLRALLKKGEIRKEWLDLNEVVHEVLRLMQSELLNAGVHVKLWLASSLPPVLGDRVHLQQVLINLIVNATEAMNQVPAARRRIVIDSDVSDNASVELRVSDCGPGIPADQFERVFEPFETTKPNGLGMGLAICRTIIAANRGHLWVAPNDGCGATFCFSLPISNSKVT